jgi:hypothetical protein
MCTLTDSGYLTQIFAVSVLSNNTISHFSDPSIFATASCAGPGSSMGIGTDMGVVTFASTETYGARKFYRGRWTAQSVDTPIVWALKRPDLICIFTDTPAFVTASDLNSYVEIISDNFCYQKM